MKISQDEGFGAEAELVPESTPEEPWRSQLMATSRHIGAILEEKGVSEEEILEDFRAFCRHRP